MTKTRDQKAAPQNLSTLAALAEGNHVDAMLLNRLVMRGPDPLSMITVVQEIVMGLCSTLDLNSLELETAIKLAHENGPGVLLKGECGLHAERLGTTLISSWSEGERYEAAWLILAYRSYCVESGYPAKIPLSKRLEMMVMACHRVMTDLEEGRRDGTIPAIVQIALDYMSTGTILELINKERGHVAASTLRKGEEDRGFYLAYKKGYHVCRVQQDGNTFWGTDGSVTLEDEGIKVDKLLTPYFGIVLPKT